MKIVKVGIVGMITLAAILTALYSLAAPYIKGL
jgi:hypothetical protein